MTEIQYYDRPVLFYVLATLITWVAWFAAAAFSHMEPPQQGHEIITGVLMLLGLASPTLIAFTMMYRNPHLRRDLLPRLLSVSGVKPHMMLLACGLMPASLLLAQVLSLFMGHDLNQFRLAEKPSFNFPLFPAWVMLFLAPLVEELAWHSYGTDCLRARFNLLTTSIMFALFWVVWHFPLSFIKDYYHSNVVATHWIYGVNFALSLFPFVILMNWLYYRSNRNILVAVVFHISAGFFNELFATHPDSKVIQTLLLMILTGVILYRERPLFLKRDFAQNEAPKG
ncbi:MAG: CPBP family intramembrane glutamic endopeptidase [Holosporales bacterium]